MNVDLLHRLVEAHGVAGFEDRVRAVVAAELEPLVDTLRTDRLGNLIATKRGSGDGPVLLVAAHMDEIGFLVRHVDARGFLRLQPLGSFDPRVLLAQRVLVHPGEGAPICGAIGTTVDPLHFGVPREPRLELKDLFVDVGEAASRIAIGDMVTLDRGLIVSGDRVTSRALDDRLGLLVMIEAMRQVSDHTATIVAVATTQEEVGSRGAVVAGFDIDPDICIALDLTIANDIPGAAPESEVSRLGAGPAIKVMDTTQVSHPGIVRHLRDIAGRHGIPYQLEVLDRGGTDASLIQRLRAGVAVATLSIPARYIHTVNETASIHDADHATTLLARYLEEAHALQP